MYLTADALAKASCDKTRVKLPINRFSSFIISRYALFQVFLMVDLLSFALICGWYWVYESENLGGGLAILILAVVSLYTEIGITLKRVADNEEELEKNGNKSG